MTTLCAIFLNKLPDSKFQIELTNEKYRSSASYSESYTEKNIIGLGNGLVPNKRQAIIWIKNNKTYLCCRRCPGCFQEPLYKFNGAPGNIQGGLDKQESSHAIWCSQTKMS